MRSFRPVLAVLLAAGLTATGCTSSGGGTPATSPAPAASGSGGADPATALAARIGAGLHSITSARLRLDGGVFLGTTQGSFAFHDGTATASDLTLDQGGASTRVITVGATSYAHLPTGQGDPGKPWARVTADSKSSFVRQVASTLSLTRAASSLSAVAALVGTATAVQDRGTTPAGHEYSLTIDPSKASGTSLGGMLQLAGTSSVPVTVDLDTAGRPVRIQVRLELGSQPFTVAVDISNYNAPVHITAPPASQVSSP